ncbi:MAG TPA: amidohydrolase family protein [Pirellulaceae bacterium]|nr:amidohydrolase family protein [Pirellulaceae bacterium]
MLHRRELFNAAIAVGAGSLLGGDSARAVPQATPPSKTIDTNISLFQWPFRRLPLDDVEALVAKLRSLGIIEAWASSFEGVLHRDIAGVNSRLAEVCGRYPELIPIGCINPELPNWEDDLRRCIDDYHMPGIRLHPNYHGYTLADPRFRQLLERATSAGRFIQITVALEDTRTQHPMVQVPDVDLAPLSDLMRSHLGAKVQLLNDRPRGLLLDELAKTPGVYFDTARVEGTDGIKSLMQKIPRGRVMFGTHAPFLIPEAALIRTYESDLGEEELQSLMWTNARQLRKAAQQ